MKRFLTKNNSGFTLIEAMVAVVILTIGVIGPLSLASRSISDGLFAQNQLTANMLAQEAIETIINRRNSNILESNQASQNLSPFRHILPDSYSGGAVRSVGVDGASGEVDPDGPNSCDNDGCYLAYNEDTGSYQNDNNGGQFLRQITVTETDDGEFPNLDELKIVVTITWKNKNVEKKFAITEHIYGK